MEQFQQRTDLALEARELAAERGEVPGVSFEDSIRDGVLCQKVTVMSEEGSRAIGKPEGKYFTLNVDSVLRRESESFGGAVSALASVLKELLPDGEGCTLVVGLGNRDITPDNIGPLTAESVLVTRHLKNEAPEDFKMLSPVAVITPGVMGTSGIESADYIKWVCDNLKPGRVVVIDALAARSLDRLCRTVQVTDTGVTPGSGVGNSRSAVNSKTLGVPVVAIGVPTVVDIRSLLADLGGNNSVTPTSKEMIVTPRNIDSEVVCAARVVAYAVNCALHDGLTLEDIDMLVG